MATGQVTRSVLEGYLDCKYLAQLRLAGRKGVRSDYEDIVRSSAANGTSRSPKRCADAIGKAASSG